MLLFDSSTFAPQHQRLTPHSFGFRPFSLTLETIAQAAERKKPFGIIIFSTLAPYRQCFAPQGFCFGPFSFTLKDLREAGEGFKRGRIVVAQQFALYRKDCLQHSIRRLQVASLPQQLAESVQISCHLRMRITQKSSPY